MSIRSISFGLFITVAVVSIGQLAAGSTSADQFEVNGLKVIVKHNPANEIVSAELYLRGGALNLNEDNQGIESLIFSSAIRGSKKYPKDKLNNILDRTAAQINTFSNKDFTAVNLRCVNRYFDEVWDVFADVIINPAFEPEDVELERNRIVLNIRQRSDNPDVYLRDLADDLFYKNHPYRLNPQGVEESINKLTVPLMREYLGDKLQTSRLLLVIVGNVDKNELKARIAGTFGRLPKGDYSPYSPPMVKHFSADLRAEARQLPTNYILGRFSAPNQSDPDYYPMVMAMDILGWRVFEEVRTKRNLSYAPNAFYSNNFSNFAGIYVTAVQPDTTIKVMLGELKKMQMEPVSAKDLRDRITIYLTRYYLNNETNAAQARFLAMYELCGLGWKESEKMVENLRKVTASDVQRVARKYFKNIQFAVLGNPELLDAKVFSSM